MEAFQILLIVAAIAIVLLLFVFLLPWIREWRDTPPDTIEVGRGSPAFDFGEDEDDPIAARIVGAVNQMGGIGEQAESEYQQSLDELRADSARAIRLVAFAYDHLPEERYLDRWALIQLMGDLAEPAALGHLDRILSQPIPPERSKDPHSFSTVGQEIVIRTTAIEVLARLAAGEDRTALDLLLKHMHHENFSVRRAAVQGYMMVGGPEARQRLLEHLPPRDHPLMDIRRPDVREVPQPRGELHLAGPEIDDAPRPHSSGEAAES